VRVNGPFISVLLPMRAASGAGCGSAGSTFIL
jgi:hypothetical protein